MYPGRREQITWSPNLQIWTKLDGVAKSGSNAIWVISTEAEILRYFPSPPAPLPEGEGRKKIRENFCFST